MVINYLSLLVGATVSLSTYAITPQVAVNACAYYLRRVPQLSTEQRLALAQLARTSTIEIFMNEDEAHPRMVILVGQTESDREAKLNLRSQFQISAIETNDGDHFAKNFWLPGQLKLNLIAPDSPWSPYQKIADGPDMEALAGIETLSLNHELRPTVEQKLFAMSWLAARKMPVLARFAVLGVIPMVVVVVAAPHSSSVYLRAAFDSWLVLSVIGAIKIVGDRVGFRLGIYDAVSRGRRMGRALIQHFVARPHTEQILVISEVVAAGEIAKILLKNGMRRTFEAGADRYRGQGVWKNKHHGWAKNQ